VAPSDQPTASGLAPAVVDGLPFEVVVVDGMVVVVVVVAGDPGLLVGDPASAVCCWPR
jgi:hypothetical protein